MEGSPYELSKGQWDQGRKGGTNKTVRSAHYGNTVFSFIATEPPVPVETSAGSATEKKKKKDESWILVRSGRRKKPLVKDGFRLDDSTMASRRRDAKEPVFTGVPIARNNKKQELVKKEVEQRSAANEKLIYVSKYNKGQAKDLQRR